MTGALMGCAAREDREVDVHHGMVLNSTLQVVLKGNGDQECYRKSIFRWKLGLN